jgi:hypothetical protein
MLEEVSQLTFQGLVKNGVVVLTNGSQLPEGTLVKVTPVGQVAGPALPAPGQKPPYPVSQEQKEALLGLIGCCKTDNPPDDEEVERIIEEYRMKKYG